MQALGEEFFGDYWAEVHQHFADSFGFWWDPRPGEPDDAPEERRMLMRYIDAARASMRSLPDDRERKLFELVQSVRDALAEYMEIPEAWIRRAHALGARISVVGDHLADAERALARKDEADVSRLVRELNALWIRVEDAIAELCRDAHLCVDDDGVPHARRLARLVDDVQAISEKIAAGRATGALHEPRIHAVATSLHRAEIAAREALSAMREAMPSVPAPYRPERGPYTAYLERIYRALGVRRTAVNQDGQLLRTEYEVPFEFRRRSTSPDEPRSALLAVLAVCRPGLWPYLPRSCRRDHEPVPTRGGRAQSNPLIEGVAAAAILGGMMPALSDDAGFGGKELFTRVRDRVRAELRRMGLAGELVVDPTYRFIRARDATFNIISGVYTPGSSVPYRHPWIQRVYPITSSARTEEPEPGASASDRVPHELELRGSEGGTG